MVHQSPATTKRIRRLERTIRKDGLPAANNLPPLLALITPNTAPCKQAIHASRRALTLLSNAQPTENPLTKWLCARRVDFTRRLLAVASNTQGETYEPECEEGAVAAAVAAAALTHVECWKAFLRGVLCGEGVGGRGLVGDFVRRFVDLRVEAMEVVKEGVGRVKERLWMLRFCAGGEVGGELARDGGGVGVGEVQKRFKEAWVAVLGDERMGREERLEALGRMGCEVIPCMKDPLELADFLVAGYNDGGDVEMRVAALDGLFVLISRHGLDYPLFYHKLYGMMTVEALFYARGRERFLALMGMVLKREVMLPGGMVAAFIKRLVRRAVMGPPEGVLWCLRLALDLLVKHPNVSYLVHRTVNLFEDEAPSASVGDKRKREKGMDDPYDDDELDPQESRADKSCLWELEILAQHVSPAVSRMVTLFGRDVRDRKRAPPPGTLQDYAELKFSDTFAAEFKRRAKSSHLAYDPPGSAPGLQRIQEILDQCIEWA